MPGINDGVYTISIPFGPGCITDPGEGRWVPLVPHGSLGPDADKILVRFNPDRGAYSLQFEKSKKYLTFEREPFPNNKLLDGDKPRYFKIEQHPYAPDQYMILVAEQSNYNIGPAMERIFPPWVAMGSSPQAQQWEFKKI
ncbi:hypothetical protein RSOLAG1IB_11654 [Rhizoctonia solani AG-1 IB]|uniref:Uncharacterized protein n=1 Tax=Thanatephorus cucumeris (strain AG1-IB / isolate 7/3/14) TaxID=1108050 RepID=M5CBC8_THACB|nr:hypothetical protein BN14_10544 [Rhizoctonia solani AG-1 IB]CEL54408.1 hypothetical protein RSOLAG1IB_11654 [Rhizoctonia solani AG-1 IB]